VKYLFAIKHLKTAIAIAENKIGNLKSAIGNFL